MPAPAGGQEDILVSVPFQRTGPASAAGILETEFYLVTFRQFVAAVDEPPR